ncbi:ComGF family competence protein [Aquibacillus salsiterrae]|uniref:ComGF family competence protein n=1 Tax=Aquibacillus salsiterrae TaxID=2950439 RepID=A0A9X4ADK6_9BACI|nr:ComGF family competence protein [Aquibacillus salsiterrae]MDC3415511.1 ComGF family competence protein [Aquibacillus salsiterrae]
MRTKQQKGPVSMDTLVNKGGYTLISLLLVFSILFITLPMIPIIYTSFIPSDYSEQLSVQQYFHFIQSEIYRSKSFSISGNQLVFNQLTGEQVIIEQYNDVVRRQVSGKGHEILIRDIKTNRYTTIQYGFKLSVTTVEGNTYEKTFSL